ncbi:toll/interleukin-1 receptor domain-containing protein [uncultured Psychroserpens sp.]|uniref:toll/interleukin-1 receptor domain-containing protein n=1 Tax=uncultured Psychroserpens sp. TaxID=255436 RepID=UPI002635F944|nr:toll/interleukin-1 receptor domain-containing protein [uncultured Psychroserpens sp.]
MKESYKHDVAISFTGANRDIALCIAQALKLKCPKIRTYYYPERQETMLGKLLKKRLLKVFQHESRLVVIIVSKDYINKDNAFVQTEIEAFIPRYLMEKDMGTYVIPVMIDDTDISEVHEALKGMTGFQWKHNPDELASEIQKILGIPKGDKQNDAQNTKGETEKKTIISNNNIERDGIFGNGNTINNN